MLRSSCILAWSPLLLLAMACGDTAAGEVDTDGDPASSTGSSEPSGGPGGGGVSGSVGTDPGMEDSGGSGDTEGGGSTGVPETCDGVAIDAGEACDGADLGSETCASQGFTGGTLACSDACTFDTSGCFSCTPVGFEDEPVAWSLPDYGPGTNSVGWFEEGFDRYSDGLNWSLRDLDGDGTADLVVHDRDQYVTQGPETGGLGRTAWRIHANAGDGFNADGDAWSLPDYGPALNSAGWFEEGYDRYSDGLNWSLLSLTGAGPDLVVHERDPYVTEGPETSGLGRTAWRVHANTTDGFDEGGTVWSLPDYGPSTSSAGWFEEGFDRYSDGLNWSLLDIDGDGRGDLVVQGRDQYVTEGPSTDGLGRSAWRVHIGGEDGFAEEGLVWSLPDYGLPGTSGTGWFREGFDRYSDGLNWSLADVTGDGRPDLLVHDRDEYVSEGPSTDGLGRTAWRVHENNGEGFDSDGVVWSLPDYGPGTSAAGWFEEGSDRYSDGLNWTLRDVTGDGAADLIVHDRDPYVTEGPSTNGLGRTAWRVHASTGDGFDGDGQAWSLPDYGPGSSRGGWFEEGFDRYSDGLNWSLTNVSERDMGNIVVYLRDQYVTEGPQVDGLGRDAWQVHATRCE
ncbi:MAG: hypothetical protein ACRBN8_30760 [Nannocystales bacterium]